MSTPLPLVRLNDLPIRNSLLIPPYQIKSDGGTTSSTAAGSRSSLSTVSFVSLAYPPPRSNLITRHSSVVIETKNRSLEETAALFDGEDATDQIANVAHNKVDEPHDEKHSDSFQEHKSAA